MLLSRDNDTVAACDMLVLFDEHVYDTNPITSSRSAAAMTDMCCLSFFAMAVDSDEDSTVAAPPPRPDFISLSFEARIDMMY